MKLFKIILSITMWIQVSHSGSMPHSPSLDAAITTETIGNPLEDSSSILTSSALPQRIEQHKREQLFKFAVNQLESLAKDLLQQSETVFSNLLKDIPPIDTTTFTAHKTNLENYLRDLYAYQTKTEDSVRETLKMFSEFGVVIDKFATEQDPKMLTILQDYGFSKLYTQTEIALKVYFTQFSQKFQEFANNLNVFERQNETKLLQWYEDFSKQPDTSKQFSKFSEFFSVFLEK